ncbi:MAM and LDL-receptor class A domain-containing protein 1 [Amphibalanus amphitrite]|uniref:MAM and LDL-receptor class A domain-containing protein 1 n=2 Tax=Amphibalanus amphitrite TaxID=1232801 RepID=A0A6A4WTZ2_AMPAM|nr:MAM and LDL-receptor class A domain-containing protein 1 [Amphibalanus amphitrite]
MTETLWEARDSTDGAWKEGKISFNTGFEHRLVFEVVPHLPSPAGRAYVAIDDVSLAEGACDSDCNFEKDLCNWINMDEGDDFDWQLGRGSRRGVTGPIRDQSSSHSVSRVGGYAFIDSSHPRRSGDIARLESAVFETPDPLCLSFYTNMFGAGVGRLSVREVSGGENPTAKVLWSVSGGSGSPLSWELGRVTVASPNRFMVQLEAEIGEPDAADIAVDSIRVEPGACPTVPASAGRVDASCHFRDDTCSWELSSTGRRLWSRAPGGHIALGSPPLQPADHFLSFDVDGYEHQAGARDTVLSPVIRARPLACLSFWVYVASHIASMPKIGSLQVLHINATSNDTRAIWRVNNHLRHGWVLAQAPFPADTPVRLALEAVRGSGVSGLLGVDDVVVHEGDCAVLPPAAAVSPFDCWFDDGECRWTVTSPAEGAETWRSAASGAGIPQLLDHTHRVETGYEYFDPFNQRSTARLVSPEVPASTQLCVSLWYTCLGGVQQDASLSLRRQLGSDNSTTELLWQVTQGQTGHTGRRYTWHYGQVQLPSAEDTARIVIEAIGMQAGFAIDDVRVVSGEVPCPTRPEWGRPAPPE